ncbi:MAG: Nucleolar protein 58 [Phylliscum demangeonii]|nr:MAG: Nucleolar protein 58 [Phylliscum demangeonii]
MTLLILAETSGGYALFKAKDKKLLKRADLASEIDLKLKQFQKFDSAANALEEASAIVESKVSPLLASLLDSVKDEKKLSLAVADPKLGNAINKLPSISLTSISDSSTQDLYRAIRTHLASLIPRLLPQYVSTMSLGLSHSLSRHKLKFSPDKVDTMIIQAIALLDDLDKELNTYAMRVKEWYGWHFPEMGRIVNDNLAYARVILAMGFRSSAASVDLAEVLPQEIEGAVKAAAEVSTGTEITKEDLENIKELAKQVVGFTEYRQQLSSYLSARMTALAPNLTVLVGELVGARLIAHSGSLLNLAKSPASTIQILGAEKALFRALKTKHDTPKYGLIYHASLIGQASGKNKGKIARMLATKAAIGLRVDALADWGTNSEGTGENVTEEEKAALGVECRLKIERRLRSLEGKTLPLKGVSIAPSGWATNQPGKWEVKEARKYNRDADGLAGDEPAARSGEGVTRNGEQDVKMIEEIPDLKQTTGSRKHIKEEHDSDLEMEDGDEDEDEDEEEEEEDIKEEKEPKPVPRSKGASTTAVGKASSKAVPADSSTAESDDGADHLALPAPAPNAPSKPSMSKADDVNPSEKSKRKTTKADRKVERKQLKAESQAQRKAKKRAKSEAKENVVKGGAGVDPSRYGELASKLGLTLSKFLKKLGAGKITWAEDGTPKMRAKRVRDVEKAGKTAAKKADKEEKTKKKRKREPNGDEVVPEKRKKSMT